MRMAKDFTNPLVVRVNGREFALNSETYDGFNELQEYLVQLIAPQKDEVYRYCDKNYESLGMFWDDIEYNLANGYDLWVGIIADYYVEYIWDSCVHGGTLGWNEYFGIDAERIDGGYKASVRKSFNPKMSFGDNVLRMRQNNYAKVGNIVRK